MVYLSTLVILAARTKQPPLKQFKNACELYEAIHHKYVVRVIVNRPM